MGVTGFDDIDIAAYLDPPLTTWRQPRRRMGEAAMAMMLELLDDNGKASGQNGAQRNGRRQFVMGGELMIRRRHESNVHCRATDVHVSQIFLARAGDVLENLVIERYKQEAAMQYTSENILVKPVTDPDDPDLILSVTPEDAGWDYISFQVRRLATGESWSFSSGENEVGHRQSDRRLPVTSNRGEWSGIGGRANVFTGAAHALYLPRSTDFTVTAEDGGDFAVTWVPTDEDHDPWLIRPEDVPIGVRGGDNVSRQINDLLPPGSPVHRLVLVEVYTPRGNWSSYPGHKHDVHIEDDDGNLIEADLEEVYFYKIDKPDGYAYQRVYTDEHSPLHAGRLSHRRAGARRDRLRRPRARRLPSGRQRARLHHLLSQRAGRQRPEPGQSG